LDIEFRLFLTEGETLWGGYGERCQPVPAGLRAASDCSVENNRSQGNDRYFLSFLMLLPTADSDGGRYQKG
jgi:hypothetical protein